MPLIRSIFLIIFISFLQNSFSQNQHKHNHAFEHKQNNALQSGGNLIENKGQWPEGVLFNTKMDGGKVWFQQHKMIYHLQDYSAMHEAHAMKNPSFTSDQVKQTLVHVNFLGSNNVTEIEKTGKSQTYFNFFKGNDQSKWTSDVHGYESFTLKNFYTGIDFKVSSKNSEVKYELFIKANSNPELVKLEYSGQKNIFIDKEGNLIIETALGKVIEKKPYAYQIINGRQVEVQCEFSISELNVSFKLGKYDKSKELTIDPTLIFASYSGSNSDNFGMTATYDYDGNLLSGGIVFGNNYPVTLGAYDSNGNFSQVNGAANAALVYGVTDIFISKYSADGSSLLYSTYLGGGNDFGGTEVVHSLVCNEQNELYFFGTSSSSDFPLVNPVQSNFNGGLYREFSSNGTHFYGNNQSQVNGGTDLIIGKLSANGSSLLGSTYYGGNSNDGLNYNESGIVNGNQFGGLMYNYGDPFRGEIMLDNSGNVYVASCTYSTDFPLSNPTQSTIGGSLDGVLIKLSSNLTTVLWSTYLGGSGRDACYAVKFDSFGNTYTTGGTLSSNFPVTPGAFKTTHSGTSQPDAFITKYGPNFILLKSTFVGTTQYDQSFFLQVDRSDFVYILGQSRGTITPTAGKYSNPNSGQFIMKFNNNLETQIWQTVFGNGNGLVNISPTAFLVDVCGNIYVSGWGGGIAGSLQQGSAVTGMPTTPDAEQTGSGDGYNLYLVVFSSQAEQLLYGTYLGGGNSQEHVDGGTSRFDSKGVVYHSACGGCGANSDFPTTQGSWSTTNNSNNCNNVVFKFSTGLIPVADFIPDQTTGCSDFTIQFQNFSTDDDTYLWDFGNGNLDSTTFEPSITYTTPGNYTVNLYVTDSVCLLTDTAQITINVLPEIIVNIPSQVNLCGNNPYTLFANISGNPTNIIWSDQADFSTQLNTNPNDNSILITSQGTYYIQAFNAYCNDTSSTIVTFNNPSQASFTPSSFAGCSPLTVNFTNTSVQTQWFLWNFGNGQVDSLNFEPTVTYTNPGQYQVALSIFDPNCPASDTAVFTIEVLPDVQINLEDTISLCTAVPITINPTSTGSTNLFVWSSTNSFSDTLNTDTTVPQLDLANPTAGYYYFSASNEFCSSIDSFLVQFISPDIDLNATDSICSGELATVSVINLTPSSSLTYSWAPTSIIVSNQGDEIQVNPISNQMVYVSATGGGCNVSDSILINVTTLDPTLVVASASDYEVLPGTTVTLYGSPAGMDSYSWSPSNGLSDPTLQQTDAFVNETTVYTLTVSEGPCTRSDTTEIKVYEIICEDPYVFIPNAFSPNGDNENDVLYVRGIWIEKMIFRIFDRWGEMVFESTDPTIGWDGTFRGRKLDPDVYDFYLDVTCVGGLKSITKGNVTLMK